MDEHLETHLQRKSTPITWKIKKQLVDEVETRKKGKKGEDLQTEAALGGACKRVENIAIEPRKKKKNKKRRKRKKNKEVDAHKYVHFLIKCIMKKYLKWRGNWQSTFQENQHETTRKTKEYMIG